jgi:rhombotail lipoprotein
MKRLFLLLAALLALGCTTPRTLTRRSDLMAYLYPKDAAPTAPDPHGASLQMPLKLGVAFIPSDHGYGGSRLGLAEEQALFDVMRAAFRDKPWVSEVRIIPSTYLGHQGFASLDQASRMYGVDVVALVSLDQVQHADPKWYSFTYLSILGAYVVRGEANSTHTLIDAAVFHVPSRTFLLRAPGTSYVKASATAIGVDAQLREDASKGLRLAMDDLSKNLEVEVGRFKEEIRKGGRRDVDLVDRRGQSLQRTGGQGWGGALGWGELLAAGVVLAALRARR